MSRRRRNSQRIRLRLGARGLGAAVQPVRVQRILPRAWQVDADPALLVSSLHTRHSQVQGLRHGTLRPETLLIDSARDPLGALIAASFLEHHPEAGRQNEIPFLGPCPALRLALGSLWLPAAPPAIQPAMAPSSRRPAP